MFNPKSSWNNFSNYSLLLFFPFICRSLMILQSISMKTTQNVQVTHQNRPTVVFSAVCKMCLYFLSYPLSIVQNVCFVLFWKKTASKPDRFQARGLSFRNRSKCHTLMSWKIGPTESTPCWTFSITCPQITRHCWKLEPCFLGSLHIFGYRNVVYTTKGRTCKDKGTLCTSVIKDSLCLQPVVRQDL